MASPFFKSLKAGIKAAPTAIPATKNLAGGMRGGGMERGISNVKKREPIQAASARKFSTQQGKPKMIFGKRRGMEVQ